MGVLEFENLNYDEAARYFASAIEIDPRFLDGRYNLALAYLRLGQKADRREQGSDRAPTSKAEDQYRKHLRALPEPREGVRRHGRDHELPRREGREDRERAQAATSRTPSSTTCAASTSTAPTRTAARNLAHLLLAIGRYDEALFHFVQCLAVDKKNPICAQRAAARPTRAAR